MTRIAIRNTISVGAAREVVFRYVATWQNSVQYVSNIRDIEQIGPVGYGLGTRLRGRARVGTGLASVASVETLSEVVEFVEPERIVCRSLGGVKTENAWFFAGDACGTLLTATVACELGDGVLAKIAARPIARLLAKDLSTTLLNLKRLVEAAGNGGPNNWRYGEQKADRVA